MTTTAPRTSASAGSAASVESGVRHDWPTLLGQLTDRRDLVVDAARWAGAEIVTGSASPAVMGAFLAAMRTKGETADELYGLVLALLDHGRAVSAPADSIDIAGTGGDGAGLMNVSTLAGIVAAGAGARVVKHGGRAASSRTAGSADLAEGLGLPLDLTPAQAAKCAARSPFSCLFAPQFNPGLRHAIDPRRQLGVPTVFNLAAPLLNPARPHTQVIGVADGAKAPVIADVLARLGRCGVVVSSADGLDKASTSASSRLWIVRDGRVSRVVLHPGDLGIAPAHIADLRGGDVAENVRLTRAVLSGTRGPLRDLVLLNAALVLAGSTLCPDTVLDQLGEAMGMAAGAIDNGAAAAALAQSVDVAAEVRAEGS